MRDRHGKCLLLLAAALLGGCAATNGMHGSFRKTDRNLDLAINGDGYFIVQTTEGGFLFTRNGELSVSATGELVNNDGYRLYPPISIAAKTSNVIVTPDGVVRTQSEGETAVLVGQIVLSRFSDESKLEKDGQYNMPTEASGDPVTGRPGAKGLGTLMVGELESAK
ncbi:MAG: hypothetical protein ACTHM6_18045 [Tepidisphaeraceae bacterium]